MTSTTSKWADLLKPPAPKVEPVAEKAVTSSTAATATAAGAAVLDGETKTAAFNAEKFLAYAKATNADHAAALAHPNEEQFLALQGLLATSKAAGLDALKALPSAQHCVLFAETRFALYLPTQEEIDVAQGWEIRTEKKEKDFSGSYIIFSAEAKKVLEVLPREKGEKKVRGATAVNLVELDAGKTAKASKSLVERAKAAIADWNARVARNPAGKKREILFTESATPLLSSALETAFELQSMGLVAAEDTAILAADLSAVITAFKNHVAFANWAPRTQEHYKKGQQGQRHFNKKDDKFKRAPKTN